MNRTTRITLEGALKRAESSLIWDRKNIDRVRRELEGYLWAQLEDENSAAELKVALEEDR